jgi:hypothetical protein
MIDSVVNRFFWGDSIFLLVGKMNWIELILIRTNQNQGDRVGILGHPLEIVSDNIHHEL